MKDKRREIRFIWSPLKQQFELHMIENGELKGGCDQDKPELLESDLKWLKGEE